MVMDTIYNYYDYLTMEICEKPKKELYKDIFSYYNVAPLRVGAEAVWITC